MPKKDDAQLGCGISQGSPAAVLCAFYVCALRSVAAKLKSDESYFVTHKKLENVKKNSCISDPRLSELVKNVIMPRCWEKYYLHIMKLLTY